MTTLRTSITVDMAGNLERKAARYSRAIHTMGRKSVRDLGMINRSAQAVGRGLDRMSNRYTAGGAIAGLTLAGKQVMDLQRRFTRLGIQANKPVRVMESLKQKIFEIAQAPDIRVDPSEITAAIEEIVEKTGDLQFAEDNIHNIGAVIQATGGAGVSVGGILAEFQKMDIKDPTQVLKAIDILNVQGKEGAFTLANLAALGPRVVSAYTSMGRTGTGALREMGAALQVIRMGTGNSEQAATSFEAVLRTLGDRTKVLKLQGAGIQVFDPEQAKQGKEVMRPINELMVEIIKKTGGKKTLLSKIFDAEAMRAFNAAAAEYQRTGNMQMLDKFMNVTADGSTTLHDSARAAKDAAAAMQGLYTAWKQFADAKLTGPIQSVTDALNAIGSNNALEAAGSVALAGGAAILGRKMYKKGDLGQFPSSKGKPGLGSALGQRRAGRLAGLKSIAKMTARSPSTLGAVVSTGITAYELGSAFEKAFINGRIGEWIYDVTHSKVDVNLKIDQSGNARVQSVQTQGIAGDTSIDNGIIPVGSR